MQMIELMHIAAHKVLHRNSCFESGLTGSGILVADVLSHVHETIDQMSDQSCSAAARVKLQAVELCALELYGISTHLTIVCETGASSGRGSTAYTCWSVVARRNSS